MILLGIETSCDETAAAVIKAEPSNKTVTLLANTISSSLSLHAKTGGIIPEIAAREQLKYILPIIKQALLDGLNWDMDKQAKSKPPIDAIAVTVGPGLIGSLLVGVETARTLSYIWNKPLIPVNHLFGHIYANWLTTNRQRLTTISFPALALVVSGGHTDLVVMQNHETLEVIGGTRDDAAGEAFDKIGRLLGLSYPAGPIIAKLAEKGNAKRFPFPRPLIGSGDFDFSFSGLKTAVLREVKTIKQLDDKTIADLCASTQEAIVDVLVKKTLKAAKKYQVKSILLGGGVAANDSLRQAFIHNTKYIIQNTKFFAPAKNLCTDNAAMIATAAVFNNTPVNWSEVTANPELYFQPLTE